MFERFLAAGIAVAGVDVGESYGSPQGRAQFTAFYQELIGKRGFSRKPVLLLAPLAVLHAGDYRLPRGVVAVLQAEVAHRHAPLR
jgi:hypothetical protein